MTPEFMERSSGFIEGEESPKELSEQIVLYSLDLRAKIQGRLGSIDDDPS